MSAVEYAALTIRVDQHSHLGAQTRLHALVDAIIELVSGNDVEISTTVVQVGHTSTEVDTVRALLKAVQA